MYYYSLLYDFITYAIDGKRMIYLPHLFERAAESSKGQTFQNKSPGLFCACL